MIVYQDRLGTNLPREGELKEDRFHAGGDAHGKCREAE
jgi:hypothetical protein